MFNMQPLNNGTPCYWSLAIIKTQFVNLSVSFVKNCKKYIRTCNSFFHKCFFFYFQVSLFEVHSKKLVTLNSKVTVLIFRFCRLLLYKVLYSKVTFQLFYKHLFSITQRTKKAIFFLKQKTYRKSSFA
jgi:hypothetical protein